MAKERIKRVKLGPKLFPIKKKIEPRQQLTPRTTTSSDAGRRELIELLEEEIATGSSLAQLYASLLRQTLLGCHDEATEPPPQPDIVLIQN